MALLTFTPPKNPSVGQTSKNSDTRSLTAQMGDGYSQRAGDGLNAIKITIPIEWKALLDAEADTIEAFFADHGGYRAFLYALPTATNELKWIVKSWQRTPLGAGQAALSTSFEQVFDL